MSDYSILCTPEQTRKVLELGASIESQGYVGGELPYDWFFVKDKCYRCPTTEQLINWLDTKKIHVDVCYESDDKYYYALNYLDTISDFYPTRPEAALAGIDAALECLSNR